VHHSAHPYLIRLRPFAFHRTGGCDRNYRFADLDEQSRRTVRQNRAEPVYGCQNRCPCSPDPARNFCGQEPRSDVRKLRAFLFTLPITAIQQAPSDRVATAVLDAIAPGWGSALMAGAIMISTFGCVNSLVLAGPRVYYAMAQNGLFLRSAATLNRANVPGRSL